MDLKIITEMELMKEGGVYARLTALESGPSSFAAWKANKSTYLGRAPTTAPPGGLLGLGWAGAVNDRLVELGTLINKVCAMSESRSLSAAS